MNLTFFLLTVINLKQKIKYHHKKSFKLYTNS